MAVTSAGEEVLSFLGSDEFPIEWEEGEQELFWIYDDLHCPNRSRRCSSTSAAGGSPATTCSGASARRSPATGSPRRSTATSTRPRRPTRASTRRRPSTSPATSRACRATPSMRPRSAPTSAGCCRTTPRTSSTGGGPPAARDRAQLRVPRRVRHGCRRLPRARAARGRDRHPRPPLEDPLDAQLRPVRLDAGAQRPARGGEGRGRRQR